MNNDPLSPVLDQLYPGARVHSGFLGQFRAVTDQANDSSHRIKWALDLTPFVDCKPSAFTSCMTQSVRLDRVLGSKLQ